jgi:hypothetical protein
MFMDHPFSVFAKMTVSCLCAQPEREIIYSSALLKNNGIKLLTLIRLICMWYRVVIECCHCVGGGRGGA